MVAKNNRLVQVRGVLKYVVMAFVAMFIIQSAHAQQNSPAEAKKAMEQGKLDLALTLIKKNCDSDPGNPDAWMCRTRIEVGLRKGEDALHSVNRVLSIDSENVPALLAKATLLAGKSDYMQALHLVNTLLSKDPANSAAFILHAHISMLRQDTADAQSQLRTALALGDVSAPQFYVQYFPGWKGLASDVGLSDMNPAQWKIRGQHYKESFLTTDAYPSTESDTTWTEHLHMVFNYEQRHAELAKVMSDIVRTAREVHPAIRTTTLVAAEQDKNPYIVFSLENFEEGKLHSDGAQMWLVRQGKNALYTVALSCHASVLDNERLKRWLHMLKDSQLHE